MLPFTSRAINIISNIPKGKVMTYGQIAYLAGSPRGARQVVRILHAMSEKYNLPWHRVINSKGEISIKDHQLSQLQRAYLESEGIEIIGEKRIDLEQFQFNPGKE